MVEPVPKLKGPATPLTLLNDTRLVSKEYS